VIAELNEQAEARQRAAQAQHVRTPTVRGGRR
jgi:hypothetical protein